MASKKTVTSLGEWNGKPFYYLSQEVMQFIDKKGKELVRHECLCPNRTWHLKK